MAELSLLLFVLFSFYIRYVGFVNLIHLIDLIDNEKIRGETHTQIHRDLDLLTTAVLRAAMVKMIEGEGREWGQR